MSTQEPPGATRHETVRGNATQHPASPARPPTRCAAPDCDQPHYAKGRCKRHYMRDYMRDWRSEQPPKPRKPRKPRLPQTLLGGYSDDRENVPRGGSTLTLFPARPKRITEALHQLAERAAREPGWTNERYRAAQDRIKEGGTP